MKYLADVAGLTDAEPVVQSDLELIEDQLWFPVKPTKVSGVETTITGPPTAGTYAVKEKWNDANGSLWVCVTAGTPGAWAQLRPALMAADPVGGTYPTGYLIIRSDLRGLNRYFDGAAWRDVLGSRDVTVQDAVNIILGTTTGTKIGTATGQKIGFYGVTPVAQQTGVADPTGGATIDAQARTAINAILARMETLGLFAVA
jgi:hypothetical protein